MHTNLPYDRPKIPSVQKETRVSYLVRALANGYVYYPYVMNGEVHICAAISPFEVKGCLSRHNAEMFAKKLERVKANEICIGRPPYTRIEVKTERIEVCAETEESSASDVL